MDLVSRLKQYLDTNGISVTQFADECNIPRPTASQLLAGRNKKVSDEIIGKIHSAYPSLSIIWLMFGEGDMMNSGVLSARESNISDQSPETPQIHESQSASSSAPIPTTLFDDDDQYGESEKPNASGALPTESHQPQTFTFDLSSKESSAEDDKEESATIPLNHKEGKRVTGIVVYYDDSTFESFIPDPERRHPFMY